MASTFTKTTRCLEGDRSRRPILMVLVAVLVLGAWGAWASMSRVAVYEVTHAARVEVSARPHPVVSRVSGRVTGTVLQLGQEVTEGQILVELDAQAQQIELEQGQARLSDLRAQRRAVEQQVQALEQAINAHAEADEIALREARAWLREAGSRRDWAVQHLTDLERLQASDLATGIAVSEAAAERDRLDAEIGALRQSAERTEMEGAASQQDRQTDLAELNRDLAVIDGQIANQEVANRGLALEIERHRIAAPIGGLVAEFQDVQAGGFIDLGQTVATIIPSGDLVVVAQYPPASAGRIQPGDRAQLRFAGFPWMQYGTLNAAVLRVANEIRDGNIRVDLAIQPSASTPIPLQHNLLATVEIEVERVAPLTLLLRAVGGALAGTN